MPRPRSAPPPSENTALLDEARRIYEPRAGRPLSRDEGREIAHNLVGFFETVASWGRAKAAGRKPDGGGEAP